MKEVMAIIRFNMMNVTSGHWLTPDLFINHAESNGRGKAAVDYFLIQGAETGHEEAAAQLSASPKLIPKRLITLVVPDDQVPNRD